MFHQPGMLGDFGMIRSSKSQQRPSFSIAKSFWFGSYLFTFMAKSLSLMSRSAIFIGKLRSFHDFKRHIQLNPCFSHGFFTKDLPLVSAHRCITDPKKCDVSLRHHKYQGEGLVSRRTSARTSGDFSGLKEIE